MIYFLTWVSIVFVSLGLIFIGRWVKEEAQIYALIGLVIVDISLFIALNSLK